LSLHNAPPVFYPLGRSSFLGGLLLGLWLAGALLTLAWASLASLSGAPLLAAGAAVLLAGLAAALHWKNTPSGQLVWDGQAWCWVSAADPAGVAAPDAAVVADLQRWLLLRLESQSGACLWLWAERQSAPERWLALRRAVYSPHRFSSTAQPHDALADASAVAVSTTMHPIQTPRPTP
jgi:toxin CptA